LINILHLTKSLGIGGTERNIYNIVKYLDRSIFKNYVLSLLEGGIRESHIKEYAYVENTQNDLQKVKDLVYSKNINVVILHRAGDEDSVWNRVLSFIYNIKNKGLCVLEFNNFGLIDNNKLSECIDIHLHVSKSSYYKYFSSKSSILKESKDHNICYCPIEVRKFNELRLNRKDLLNKRSELLIGEDDFVLLRVGRPDVRKWGDLLLYVIPKVVAKIPNAKFIFMSAPKSRIKYLQNKRYSKNVIFLNNTSDDKELAKIYSIADVYIHSSRRGESFGQTLVEAFAFKLPVVVNSTPWRDNAQIELIDHMENGIIANTVDGFADALFYLFQNPDVRKKLGENGFNKALSLYEVEKVSKSLSKIILTSMQNKGVVVDSFLKRFEEIDIYPTQSEIMKYIESEYNERLQNTWNSEKPKRPGSYMNRLRWFIFDAIDVLSYRLGDKFTWI